ncbi:MAG: phage head-tail connector protein [Deltaproteobacteria bacterium]|nr:phage head-tail connector protein [Deltaproteobacteria bacterium]MBW2081686.1 phage head-tail connector protein [Deltaproteobacteria bacterium]MBW2298881.1 phage head-tail connector protein [Deltaproteobacteria bacterium]
MAVDSDALTSLDNVKEFLGISGNTDDALLENLIDRVTDLFESYCDRKFKAADYTEYHDGKGSDKLFPDQFPINSVASIHDDTDWTWGSDTLIDSDDYRIVDGAYIQCKSDTFTDDVQNVKVVYNAGYDSIPEDLEQAAIMQVAWLYKKGKGGGLLGVSSKSLMDGSISFTNKDLLPEVRLVLERYRKRKL